MNRRIEAVHARRETVKDPDDDIKLAGDLKKNKSREDLLRLFSENAAVDSADSARMRRILLRALAKRAGHGLTVGVGVTIAHPETFELGDNVFIGNQVCLQGRFDGKFIIGNNSWLGPLAFFDARDLVIEEYVGWGPGAKVLGSTHTGEPTDVPIIQTELIIKPVRIGSGADIGVNAVIMPGVAIGEGAIVGAGAVVIEDVAAYTIVGGVPARLIKERRR